MLSLRVGPNTTAAAIASTPMATPPPPSAVSAAASIIVILTFAYAVLFGVLLYTAQVRAQRSEVERLVVSAETKRSAAKDLRALVRKGVVKLPQLDAAKSERRDRIRLLFTRAEAAMDQADKEWAAYEALATPRSAARICLVLALAPFLDKKTLLSELDGKFDLRQDEWRQLLGQIEDE